jgi:hypothetical protein
VSKPCSQPFVVWGIYAFKGRLVAYQLGAEQPPKGAVEVGRRSGYDRETARRAFQKRCHPGRRDLPL